MSRINDCIIIFVCCAILLGVSSCIEDEFCAVVDSYKSSDGFVTVEFYRHFPSFKNLTLLDGSSICHSENDLKSCFQSGKLEIIETLEINEINSVNGRYIARFNIEGYENTTKFLFVAYTPYPDNVYEIDIVDLIEPEEHRDSKY